MVEQYSWEGVSQTPVLFTVEKENDTQSPKKYIARPTEPKVQKRALYENQK